MHPHDPASALPRPPTSIGDARSAHVGRTAQGEPFRDETMAYENVSQSGRDPGLADIRVWAARWRERPKLTLWGGKVTGECVRVTTQSKIKAGVKTGSQPGMAAWYGGTKSSGWRPSPQPTAAAWRAERRVGCRISTTPVAPQPTCSQRPQSGGLPAP